MFNQQVNPRLPQTIAPDELHLLFCFEGTFTPGDVFKPNHFVANVLVQLGGKGSCQRQFLSKIQSKVAMLILCVVLVRVIRLSFLPFLPACAIFKAGSSTSSTACNKLILPTHCSSKPNNNATLASKPILISKNEYDVANFRVKAKHMDNLQRADLIKNVFKSYSFPISKTNCRSFLDKWFNNYSWLCYSPSLDGAFCLPCVLFGDRFPTKTSTIKKLFPQPITHWNDP